MDITVDEIVSDIQNTIESHKELNGLTFNEIQERLGFGEKKTRKLLKKWVQSGKLKVTCVNVKDVTGRNNRTYVYHT